MASLDDARAIAFICVAACLFVPLTLLFLYVVTILVNERMHRVIFALRVNELLSLGFGIVGLVLDSSFVGTGIAVATLAGSVFVLAEFAVYIINHGNFYDLRRGPGPRQSGHCQDRTC